MSKTQKGRLSYRKKTRKQEDWGIRRAREKRREENQDEGFRLVY